MAYISKNDISCQLECLRYYLRNKNQDYSVRRIRSLYDAFLSFLEQFGSGYQKEILRNIINKFGFDLNQADYIMREIYSHIGIYNEENDEYIRMARLVENKFDIKGQNILEIGSGPFPRLSEIISQKQHGSGTITAYDPNLVSEHIKGIKLVKQKFTDTTLLDNYDLVVAMIPCKATPIILRSKRFIFSLCGCIGFNEEEKRRFNGDMKAWLKYLIELAESYCNQDENIVMEEDPFSDLTIMAKTKKI